MLGLRSGDQGQFHDCALVLVHGYLGAWPWLYWLPMRPTWRELKALGCRVVLADLPSTGRVEVRARRLGAIVRRLSPKKVIVVAHSMGGIDARYAVWRYDPHNLIKAVITINTPHLGTPLAEWAIERGSFIARLVRSLDEGGLHQLTPEAMVRFNERVQTPPSTKFLALGSYEAPENLHPLLHPYGEWLEDHTGANDGIVPTHSALPDEGEPIIGADHLSIIGHRHHKSKARDKHHMSRLRDLLYESLDQASSSIPDQYFNSRPGNPVGSASLSSRISS